VDLGTGHPAEDLEWSGEVELRDLWKDEKPDLKR
jgi:hypothetical protein